METCHRKFYETTDDNHMMKSAQAFSNITEFKTIRISEWTGISKLTWQRTKTVSVSTFIKNYQDSIVDTLIEVEMDS